MSQHLNPVAKLAVLLLPLAFVGLGGCGDSGGGRAFCEDVCAHVEEQCSPHGRTVRPDCVEECEADLASRVFEQDEETCVECCLDTTFTMAQCTAPTDREIGLPLCMDQATVCHCECEDQIPPVESCP